MNDRSCSKTAFRLLIGAGVSLGLVSTISIRHLGAGEPKASVAEIAPAERLPDSFHLPVSESVETLSVTVETIDGRPPPRWEGKLVVDGVVTDAVWPEGPPTAYRLDGDRYLLDDTYSGGPDYVWNTRTKSLTMIGKVSVGAHTPIGRPVLRSYRLDREEMVYELLDFPPDSVEPRILFSHEPMGSVVGSWNGGLLVPVDQRVLAILKPGEVVQRIELDLEDHHIAGPDTVRGDKMLVTRTDDLDVNAIALRTSKPYEVEAALYDLKTHAIESLGRFPGGVDVFRAVPLRAYGLSWITRAEAEKRRASTADSRLLSSPFGSHAYVVEATHELLAPGNIPMSSPRCRISCGRHGPSPAVRNRTDLTGREHDR